MKDDILKNWSVVVDIRSMFRFANKVFFLTPHVLLENYTFITTIEIKYLILEFKVSKGVLTCKPAMCHNKRSTQLSSLL